MKIDVTVESKLGRSPRARQLEGMFDVPPAEKVRLNWRLDAPIESFAWNVGLIVGPSGSGKSTIARAMFGAEVDRQKKWGKASVLDDFDGDLSMEQITAACMAVGFNTVPAWLRPFAVLSNGERFRVELARRLLEGRGIVVVDEFTSVVDRRVAKIAAHAVQKFVRREKKQFVAVSCHEDVIEWLQPEWVIEPAKKTFRRRALRRRPDIQCVIGRVARSAWDVFSAYHYLTAELHHSARCFGLWADGALAAFAAILPRPHPKRKNLYGVSRLVTLPDFQGLGLAFVLLDTLGAAYRGLGRGLHMYPAHPSLTRSLDQSPRWCLRKAPGTYSSAKGPTTQLRGRVGGRPCAVFSYEGPALDSTASRSLIETKPL